MDGEEYEVESVTRARVHDKKGKKITWRYYVKWKGYGWDDSTWEPTESFQAGSEHILETFWQRINTHGRDISDAQAFKKGEELFISGPPGKKGLKRKASTVNVKALPSLEQVTVSNEAPTPTPRKRRRMQLASEDEDETEELSPKRKVKVVSPRPQRRLSVGGGQRSVKKPVKSLKRRRASYPGPRKAPKRLPSAGDSQLDADGETDPDAIEVDDELAQMSMEDAAERPALQGLSTVNDALEGGVDGIEFDDLAHFYSGNAIDIEQGAEGLEPIQGQKIRDLQTSKHRAPASPVPSSPDPLFDSASDQEREATRDLSVPFHRARAANPLIKLIDTTTAETRGAESRITAKARLMSLPASGTSSSAGRSRNTAKRGAKPGPGRSSSGFNKNRSSLLTATKGILQSVKGKYTVTNVGPVKPDEIEEAPAAVASEERNFTISSWSDEDVVVEPGLDDQTMKDAEMLPDYEDDSTAQEKVAEQPCTTPSPGPETVEDQSLEQSAAVAAMDTMAINQIADVADSVADPVAQASDLTIEPSAPSMDPATATAEEVAKKSVELAKEQLFPSAQLSSNAFGDIPSSFESTIFGPLYQGVTSNHAAANGNESLTTFKLILDDSIGLPLTLKDCSQIKGRINDVSVGKSSSGRVAVFYDSEDALAIVTTLRSSGTARVVPDPSADATQKEHFATFLRRFESSHTLIAPAGKEVCVLYLSENAGIAEKLCAPSNLVGLSSTLLISRASIENQLAYVAAAFAAKPL
ncbi:hypothetical protein PAXRUDRAFT_218120 [Paxillus rubicundulus Ve08.2h10]|uniref:Unplaced genomic scaffold scaffold_110, whole genome shotgun sequence n=1 Tax=Paxillus rubicundulus Ve08.2h10 TaxID=930991 RepID=A0A0D0DH91_9AGAM|nr:hypothetical protein PAXRUDRAFT_218120 [Paxillus rubicundulus Ve08.2h10]